MTEPGRYCPLSYRTQAADLASLPAVYAETAYIIGGLYGNSAALQAILDMAATEHPPPVLVFNGDFNWFNADSTVFRQINRQVLAHYALLGNVEAELVEPQPGAGCGCAYPAFVDEAVVTRSNQIMARLQTVAAEHPDIIAALAILPRQQRLDIAGLGIGVVHGDPDSLAGWGLGIEAMPPPGVTPAPIAAWFAEADVRVLASSHTCVAYAQRFTVSGQSCAVFNNGAAGMPNFRHDPRVVITRISRTPAPFAPLYACRIGALHCEAIAVEWAQPEWLLEFERLWPEGSPAWQSYRERIVNGPHHRLERANRLLYG